MAVEDKYVDADVEAGKKGSPIDTGGAPVLAFAGSEEIAAADDDGSIYRLARIPANAIPLKGEIWNDAITAGTDYDVGLYKPGVGGAAVDIDLLAAALDMSTGAAIGSPKNGLATSPALDEIGKTLWELLGLSEPNRQDYDLALTANTVGSSAGTISWYFLFAVAGA